MYSNQMSLGENPSGPQKRIRSGANRIRHRAPETKGAPPDAKKNKNQMYGYIEGRSGEYDDTERDFMGDAYADGWSWAAENKSLSAFAPYRSLKKAQKAEILKLFEKGFNDYTEAKNEKAEV
jgi:hypothetical protein